MRPARVWRTLVSHSPRARGSVTWHLHNLLVGELSAKDVLRRPQVQVCGTVGGPQGYWVDPAQASWRDGGRAWRGKDARLSHAPFPESWHLAPGTGSLPRPGSRLAPRAVQTARRRTPLAAPTPLGLQARGAAGVFFCPGFPARSVTGSAARSASPGPRGRPLLSTRSLGRASAREGQHPAAASSRRSAPLCPRSPWRRALGPASSCKYSGGPPPRLDGRWECGCARPARCRARAAPPSARRGPEPGSGEAPGRRQRARRTRLQVSGSRPRASPRPGVSGARGQARRQRQGLTCAGGDCAPSRSGSRKPTVSHERHLPLFAWIPNAPEFLDVVRCR